MAPPTRPQIEAVVTLPTYLVEYNTGSGWVAVSADWVLDVSGAAESTAGTGVQFGAEATAKATIRLDPQAASIPWEGTRVRISFGFATSDRVVRFVGVITEYDRDDEAVVWTAGGFDETIARTPIFSPLFHRRPAATATSATSVEDPTSPSYQAGLVNYICWQAGGRPYEQAASYPSATFYYSCGWAPIAPEWSWCGGENAWDELGRLARSCGMVIFQGADGVLRAQGALQLAGTSAYTFTEATYGAIRERASRGETCGAVRCRFTARRLQSHQVVYEDTTPRVLSGLSTLAITIEFQQPVYDLVFDSGTLLPIGAVNITTLEGKGYSAAASIANLSATRATLTIGNDSNDPLVISRIQLRGRPIAPVEDGIAVVGSGTPEREFDGDTGVYVQSRAHAERLAKLYLDTYAAARPTRTLSGCGYDPDRTVGEVVGLTNSAWGLSNVAHRITAIRHADTGATMEVDLTPVAGLVASADVFVIGTSYSSGDTRQLSY